LTTFHYPVKENATLTTDSIPSRNYFAANYRKNQTAELAARECLIETVGFALGEILFKS